MPTGPEHYRSTEQLLGHADEAPEGSAVERYYLAAAQVHATLALAAATALNDDVAGMPPGDYSEWLRAAAGPEPEVSPG
jgi:hypothetical protein